MEESLRVLPSAARRFGGRRLASCGPVGLALGAGVGAVVGTAGWLVGKLF